MSESLQITTQDGVTYVTTVIDPTSTNSATPAASGELQSIVGEQITPPKGFAPDFGSFVNSLLTAILVIAALLVFGYLIWGGFQWIGSGGDKGKTEAARNRIMAAIVGLIILAGSYAVLTIILRFLGFHDLNDLLGSVGTINGPSATTSGQLQQIQFIRR